MIILSLGTHKLNFNRLLKEVDQLIEEGIISEEVIAQSGYSTYQPRNYKAIDFIAFEEFEGMLDQCSYVITHGGAGIITKSVQKGKKVIAVPRLKKYGEHVDDHQLEIIGQFADNDQIIATKDLSELRDAILKVPNFIPKPYDKNNKGIIQILEGFVKTNFN